MAAVVDSFDLLFHQISNGFHAYSEVLSLIGAYYVTKKVFLTCYRVQYVVRIHLYPKLRPKRDLVKEFGEWAVVTGSTDGIGKAYAMELAHHGVNIVLISRSNEKLRRVASEIESFYGVQTHVIKADFSLGSEIYEDISTKLQGMQIGILVNNVGAMDFPQLFLEMDADRIRQLININIGAATMMTKLVLPQMVERKQGVVVNVSSGTSIHPSPQLALYSACKTYLDVFSQALEYEYRDHGIIVQTLLPSYVATKMADFGETMPRSRFLIPTAAVYAKHAVASIGIANRTAGYWPHAVQSSNLHAGDTAWLESEVLTADDTCFKFWCHMYGKGMGSLNVYTRDQSNQMMMLEWSEHGNHGDRWVEGQVSLSGQNSFTIIMEATFGGNYTGDMALDDTFIMQTGLCNDSGIVACDFEEDMCGYTQESDDEFDWTRLNGPTPTSGTGAVVDHTTGTADGYYVYIETSSKQASYKARLSTPMVQSSASQCLTFWYHMYGMSIDTLNIYTRRNDGQQKLLLVWSVYGEQTDDWLLGNIQLNEPIRYQVIFEGVVGFFSMGDIALDDISIYDGDCPATSTCEFESPTICGYRNDQTDDFDWLRWSGPTPTDNTGPSEDVTYNTQYGHYMYIKSDPPQLEGDMARLIGPHMSHVTERTSCWSFYYHMNGKNIGSLEIQLNGNSAVPTSLTTITGSQGPTWKRESVEVHATGYEIIFKGVVGNGTEGDIAIDSVDAVERSCLSCDFEDDLCGWENVEGDDFNWIRFKGPTETPGTGPDGDHTIGTPDGFYVLMSSADPRQPGDLAKLTTTFIPSTDAEDMCLTFWYSMVGIDTGTLELSRDDLDGIGSRVFWRLSGQQSSSGWLQATVPYKNAAMFEFRGIVGNGNRSDIGLDDLNPVSGKCDVTPPAARVEIPTTTSQPRTTGPTTGPKTGPGTEPHKETEATPTINTEPPMTGTTLTNVMRTEGQTGPEPLAITLGVLGGIVAVFLIVIAAWFITKRRSSSKLEIAALQNNMENPAYDPEGPGGDIVLREMEKKPVEMESRYHTFSPIVEANDGFENPTYASMTSPDDAGI